MAISKSRFIWNVRKLNKNAEKLRFDLAIQRNEVWNDEQRSLFMHTLITGYPFPPVYAVKDDEDIMWFLDGKQRISAVLRFVNEGFMLSQNTPPVIEEDGNGNEVSINIAGKKFSELSQEHQTEILDADFDIYNMTGITEEHRDEMFYRLNNGSPLRNVEITRAIASSKIMEFIKEIVSRPFFHTSVNISEKMRNRFVDEEMLLQIVSLIEANKSTFDRQEFVYISCNGPDIRKFVKEIRDSGIPDDTKAIISNVTNYLSEAFPVEDSKLKKVHVPMLFLMAAKFALPNQIPPMKFSGWVQGFFDRLSPGSPYNNASRAGSAKRENIEKRLSAMRSDYFDHINSAEDYKIPEPKTPRSVQELDNSIHEEPKDDVLQRVLGYQENPMFDDNSSLIVDLSGEGDENPIVEEDPVRQ